MGIIENRIIEEAKNVKYGTECLICSDIVDLTEEEVIRIKSGGNLPPKVCDRCKKTIRYMRDTLEKQGYVL